MVLASQGDPTMQITITIREIANGFLVSDQYGEHLGHMDARPVETFFQHEQQMIDAMPGFTAQAIGRQRIRDEEYRRMMEREQRDFGQRVAEKASNLRSVYRGEPVYGQAIPVNHGGDGHPIGWSDPDATPPDDGDPHLTEEPMICGGPIQTEETRTYPVDESAEFIRDKPVMDTSAFGQRDEGPAEK
jgi:hypothetical protein